MDYRGKTCNNLSLFTSDQETVSFRPCSKDVEGSDPAMEYFIGKLGREVLIFLRRPPTAKEQAILGG